MTASIYEIALTDNAGQALSMAQFKGKVVLVVNTASKCGFTPQYQGLEALWQQHKDNDFVVLGFPCNQFGSQEPGDDGEVKSFCEINYGVSFPLFAKTDVNGEAAHPLFTYLKQAAPGILGTEAIKWNFTKFLVDKNGAVVKRYASKTKPEAIADDVAALL